MDADHDDVRGNVDNDPYEKDAESEALVFIDRLNEYSEMFTRLCDERHRAGQEEYGKFTFMANDVVRMMLEELADTANYCRYQAVKLLFLQEGLERMLTESALVEEGEEEITIGIQSFKGTRDTGWSKKQ